MGSLNFQYRSGNKVSEEVGLLISILMRYPEVYTIHYLKEEHALKFHFMLLNDEKRQKLTALIKEALDTFFFLEKKKIEICRVEQKVEDHVSLLVVTRDVSSLSQTEVGLIVELVKSLDKEIVCDEMDLSEDELVYQEEIIDGILATMGKGELAKSLVALREEGKVLVYNQ